MFNGSNTKEDIETYTCLTHFIQYRTTPSGIYGSAENYCFDFKTDNIIRKDEPRDYNANRIKLTLKLVGEVLAQKKKIIDTLEISDCVISWIMNEKSIIIMDIKTNWFILYIF